MKDKGTHSSVLITGGSGFVGKYLTSALLSAGYRVSHLSRKGNQFGKVRVYRWDPEKEIVDPAVFEGIDCIVHLAGANIGEKRWKVKRKEEIIRSRVQSSRLMHKIIKENSIRLKAFISASATGYYGLVTSHRIFTESESPGNDFVGTVCRLWEDSADLFAKDGIRTVKMRSAMVIERNHGILPKLLFPARYRILPLLGNQKQYLPWIHIKDLCNIYLKAIRDENMAGAYNAVAPEHVNYKSFINTMIRVIDKGTLKIPVPGFLLSLGLGERSDIILKGSRISSEKIISAGYSFAFPGLEAALHSALMSD